MADQEFKNDFFFVKNHYTASVAMAGLLSEGCTKFPFYELGQQGWGQGCIRNKCDVQSNSIK